MLTVTPPAAEALAEILNRQPLPPEVVLRFVPDAEGIGMQPSEVAPDDTTFDHNGRTVLALSGDVAELLSAHTLDVIDGELALVASDDAPSE
ncbi:MAG: hypothetical protein D6744_16060 [Planctomycetota bacterium]|nr:MAG: hypothetical protein D6744_16060 [Planctomycetota bacterium]